MHTKNVILVSVSRVRLNVNQLMLLDVTIIRITERFEFGLWGFIFDAFVHVQTFNWVPVRVEAVMTSQTW
jgi:hypothetical protein